MLKQEYTNQEFKCLIKKSDYFKYFKFFDKLGYEEDAIFKELEEIVKGTYLFNNLEYKKNDEDKFYYKLNDIEKDKANLKKVLYEDFILRKTNKNIKKVYGIVQSDRFKIIKTIINFFDEKSDFCILKMDISKFYESIDRKYLLENLNQSILLSYESKQLINNFFTKINTPGLPRGINISSTLSEYYMRKFDKEIKNIDDVFFYARYVDDIIIMSIREIECSKIENLLPKGLLINKKKLISISTEKDSWEFDFLGYKFEKYKSINKKDKKDIKISISERKIKNIQSKLIKAFLDYRKTRNFNLLKNRILFLSVNYPIRNNKINMNDYNKYKSLHGGNAFSYPFINSYDCLKNIDTFYYKLLNTKSFKRINDAFSEEQKKKLRKYSFYEGYIRRILRNFELNEMFKITECWR